MAEVSKTSENNYEKQKASIANLCMDGVKNSCSSSSVPTSPVGLRKGTSAKRQNCLCSPTTHAGSFRCRYHRNSGGGGLMRTSASVGSKLSELGDKPTAHMYDNVAHIPFIAAHGQGSSASSTFWHA